MKSDIRVIEVETQFTPTKARTPLKFGHVIVDSTVLFECRVTVENGTGRRAVGRGAILLSDAWAFPSDKVDHTVRESAMITLSRRCADLLSQFRGSGHPIDIFRELEPGFDDLAASLSRELALAEPLPRMATLVCASPLDAALHDGFGLADDVDTYEGYTRDFMAHDLSWYLGDSFAGLYPSQFLRPARAERIPVFHLVGGLDKLTNSEAGDAGPRDGLPNSLEDWIKRDGVYCFKLKLRGNDLPWDLDRILTVDRMGKDSLGERGRDQFFLSLDTNEVCDSPDYMIELLQRVRESSPATFKRVLYVEQPTERDLTIHRHRMEPLARLVPVLADESLSNDEQFDLALDLGWSGPVLKTCKCQTHAILWAAKAKACGLPYSIQDLSNPGLALLQSVGLAARTFPILGVEYNSRQFFPSASPEVQARHGEAFAVRDGEVSTASLGGLGLGFRMTDAL